VFTFIESTPFARVRDLYLDDDEYSELQQFLMQNPESGKVVRGSGECGSCAGAGKVAESAAGCA